MNLLVACSDRGSTYPHKLGKFFHEADYADIAKDLLPKIDLIRQVNKNPCVIWWVPTGMNEHGELMLDFNHMPHKLDQYIQAHALLERHGVESIAYVGPGDGEHAKKYDADRYAGLAKIPGTIIVDSAGYYQDPFHPDVIYIKSHINDRRWGIEGGPTWHWKNEMVDTLLDTGNEAALRFYAQKVCVGRKFITFNDRPNWKNPSIQQGKALSNVGFQVLIHHFHVNAKTVEEWKAA